MSPTMKNPRGRPGAGRPSNPDLTTQFYVRLERDVRRALDQIAGGSRTRNSLIQVAVREFVVRHYPELLIAERNYERSQVDPCGVRGSSIPVPA